MVHAHLFCSVVDNFGDAGIAWILACGLAHDYNVKVTLFIDDPKTLQALAPTGDQTENIRIIPVTSSSIWPVNQDLFCPPQLVIEILSGTAPSGYDEWINTKSPQAVWMIYEYLSAESWVEECHLQPSPHPRLPLNRTFFYPGFTVKTGGLLYRPPPKVKQDIKQTDEMSIGLFTYDNPVLVPWLKTLMTPPNTRYQATNSINLYIPPGPASTTIASIVNQTSLPAQTPVIIEGDQGRVTIHFIPFCPRDQFDAFLRANTVNFVRGEESLTAAIMAAKPLIWHIYPQEDQLHLKKLTAFCEHYTHGLAPEAAAVFIDIHKIWNGDPNGPKDIGPTWNSYCQHLPALTRHAQFFCDKMLTQGSAIKNLMDFYQKHC